MASRLRFLPLLRLLVMAALLALLVAPAPSEASLQAALNYRHRLEAAGNGEVTDLAVVGPYAYLAEGVEGLRIADISDPVEPPEYVAYSHPAALRYVTAANDQLYGVAPTGELHLFSLEQPSAPALQSSLPLSLTSKLHIQQTRAYGLTATGLQIIDVANPQAPAVIGTFAFTWAADLAIAGTTAYVLGGLSDYGSHFYAIDVADPQQARLIGTYDHTVRGGSTFTLSRISLERGAAYLAGGGCVDVCAGGIVVVDITDPTNLRERTYIPVGYSEQFFYSPPSNIVVIDHTVLITITYCRYWCNHAGLAALTRFSGAMPPEVVSVRYPDDVRQQNYDSLYARTAPPVILGTRLLVPMHDKGLLVYSVGSYQVALPLLQ